jgi:YbgC/YbaW family acyl-CoA thioester hydrolase
MHEFTTRRRIEFADVDMAGIVHFSRYFVFMETAEHLFLDAAGTSVAVEHEGHQLGWPRVAAACEYKSAAHFGDTLEIRVRVQRKGVKSMTYEFSFRCDEREVASGSMTSVCCRLLPGGGLRSIPIPEAIVARLEEPPH